MTAKEAFLAYYRETWEEECDFEDVTRITFLAIFEAGWEARRIEERDAADWAE